MLHHRAYAQAAGRALTCSDFVLSSLFCTLQAGEILFQDTHKDACTVFITITLVKYFLQNGHLGPRGSFLGNPDLSIHEIQNRSVSILVTILAVFMDTS